MNFVRYLKPRAWAGLYFAQIFLFAIFYSFFSYEFYHSNSNLEPTLSQDRSVIQSDLKSYILKNRAELRIDEHFGANFPYEVYLSLKENGRTEVTVADPLLGLNAVTGELFLASGPEGLRMAARFVGDPKIIDKYGKEGFPPWTYIEYIPSLDLVTAFYGWEDANNGRPSRKNGLIFRMLYLSVVTTTTLGYGDIVPLSNLTRLAVAFQSILGIVIAAGFVQSLLNKP